MILQETKKVMRRKEIDYIFAVGVITLMTGLSEYLHEPEIIFPEIAALTAGALAAPAQTWKVNKRQMTGYIAICAIIGVCTVRYLEIGHWGQMTVAFAAGQLIFLCSKTTFAPMISAAVLPVLLQTESWIYPISAVSLTGIVCILQSISVKAGVHQKVNYVPADPVSTAAVKKGIKRTVCGAFLAAAALATDWKFAAAPPLLVAFTEFTGKPKGAGKEVYKTTLIIVLCAAAGTVCRLLITEKAGLPLTVSAFAASVIFLIIMSRSKMWRPPAGAMAILPMLIGEKRLILYPVQVTAGIIILATIAVVFFIRSNPEK